MLVDDQPVLFLPDNPQANLTTMDNVRNTPWHPDGGFTVHELGQRLRTKPPSHENWLRSHGLEIVEISAPEGWLMPGTWYRLVS